MFLFNIIFKSENKPKYESQSHTKKQKKDCKKAGERHALNSVGCGCS